MKRGNAKEESKVQMPENNELKKMFRHKRYEELFKILHKEKLCEI
jgi:hypothetical protein